MKTNHPYGTVSGTFRNREDADKYYQELEGRGYSSDDINVMMSQDTRDRYYAEGESTGNMAAEGAATGSAVGGVVGAIAGAIIAAGASIALPGIGLVVAGPIAGALAGGGAGGAAGGVIGGLVGLGIPEDHAKLYREDIKDGNIVMTTHPRNREDADYMENRMRGYNADNVYYSDVK